MIKRKLLGILNVFAFFLMVFINYLAINLPLNNITTKELSDFYSNSFTPASITFSIWGVIYLLLLIFILVQLQISFKKDEGRNIIDKIGYLFFISCVANSGWIFAWHYNQIPISLAIIAVLLLTLQFLYRRIYLEQSFKIKLTTKLAFSIYFGWVSVAFLANLNVFFTFIGWDRVFFSELYWTLFSILIAISFGLLYIFNDNDIFYGLVIDWALFGILLKRLEQNFLITNPISLLSILGISIISGCILFKLIKKEIY